MENESNEAGIIAAAVVAGIAACGALVALVRRKPATTVAAAPVVQAPVIQQPVTEELPGNKQPMKPTPVAPLTLSKGTKDLINANEELRGRIADLQPDKQEKSLEEVLEEGWALVAKWEAERVAAEEDFHAAAEEDFWEAVAEEAAIEQAEREGWALFTAAEEAAEKVKISAVLPWRFNRPTDIPRPEVVDARRLAKLPERDIRLALHRAYADDTVAAKKLHARLRGRAERAVFPLREDPVGALEDIYVVHPDRVMHD